MKSKLAIQKSNRFYNLPIQQKIRTISNNDLETLPELVQNYLKKINLIGKQEIKRVRLKQEGEFRLAPDSKWKSFDAEQYVNTENLSFLWYAKISMVPLVNIHVIDEYIEGKGNLNAKLFNLINVVDKKGPKFDQGEFLRFLSEMPWYPTCYSNENLKWSENGNSALDIKLNDECHNNSVSGTLIFNKKGLIDEFVAERYYSNEKEVTLEDWHGYWDNYENFDGILVPTKFKVCWDFDDQEYCYIKGTTTDIEFNNPNLY